MKKYVFEAAKGQLEKPTEPKYLFCTTAKTILFAESEDEARVLAENDLRRMYYGTGVALGEAKCVSCTDLPVDWSYGYGDARGTGTAEEKAALATRYMIR